MKRFLNTFFMSALLLAGFHLPAQSLEWGVRAGLLAGGPIPVISNPDSSSGSLGLGPSVALHLSWQATDKWSLCAELGYAYRGADYSQLYRRDTSVVLELIPGFYDTIPSFYYADVNGTMKLHYLELPVFARFAATERWRAQGGLVPAFLLGGEDAGDARIQIGEGGIFNDTIVGFNNLSQINRFDLAAFAGMAYVFPAGWWIEFRGQRSLIRLYQPGFLAARGFPDQRLYHTQFYLGLGYKF